MVYEKKNIKGTTKLITFDEFLGDNIEFIEICVIGEGRALIMDLELYNE